MTIEQDQNSGLTKNIVQLQGTLEGRKEGGQAYRENDNLKQTRVDRKVLCWDSEPDTRPTNMECGVTRVCMGMLDSRYKLKFKPLLTELSAETSASSQLSINYAGSQLAFTSHAFWCRFDLYHIKGVPPANNVGYYPKISEERVIPISFEILRTLVFGWIYSVTPVNY